MRPSWIKTSVQCLLVILLFLGITRYFLLHKDEFRLLAHVNKRYIGDIAILTVLINLITAYKYFFVYRLYGLKCSFNDWLKIFMIGNFLNLHFTQGANLYRTAELKRKHGFTYTHSVSGLTYVTYLEIILNFAIPGIFVLIFLPDITAGHQVFILYYFLFVATIALSPFMMWPLIKGIKWKGRVLQTISLKLHQIFSSLMTHIKNIKVGMLFTVLTLLTFGLNCLSIHLGFFSMNKPISVATAIAFTGVLLTSRLVYILPGNLRITEVLCGYLSKLFMGIAGVGILVSAMLRLIVYVTNLIIVMGYGLIKIVKKDARATSLQ